MPRTRDNSEGKVIRGPLPCQGKKPGSHEFFGNGCVRGCWQKGGENWCQSPCRAAQRGQVFTFTDRDTFLVGRSRYAHFQLLDKDKYFSRIHFLMEIDPPNCKLVDLRSRNGTFVNGERVQVLDLKDGDRIQAGY